VSQLRGQKNLPGVPSGHPEGEFGIREEDIDSHRSDRLIRRMEESPQVDCLHHRIDEVIDYAGTHLPRLDEYVKRWPSDEGELVRAQDKIFSETAMLLLVVDRVGASERSTHWGELVDLCVRGCRSERVLCAMARHPRVVSSLGLGHLFLTGLGNIDEAMDFLVSNACGTGDIGRQECVPFRRLELAWAWKQASRYSNVTRLGASARGWVKESSAIAWDSNGIYVGRDDCYSLTHTLMYATDFGANSIPGIDVERLRASISSSICYAISIADFDLLVELLISDAVLPGPASAAARCGWAIRSQTLSEMVHLPGPPPYDKETTEETPEAWAAYEFQRDYHPAYVDALLCASILARKEVWFDPSRDNVSDSGAIPLHYIMDAAWADGDWGSAGMMARKFDDLEVPLNLRAEVLAEVATIALVQRYDLIGLRRFLDLLQETPLWHTRGVQLAHQFLTNQFTLARYLESRVRTTL
jgi:hypothetical protein